MLDSAFPHQLAITGLTTFPELTTLESHVGDNALIDNRFVGADQSLR
jgi:hypothetical protein